MLVELSPKFHKISYRRVSFDDGYVDDFTPLSSNQVCYSYNNTSGGSYFITAELVDSNQCSNNFTFPTPVLIYPEIVRSSITPLENLNETLRESNKCK